MARAAYDYVAGGAGGEESLAQKLAAWRRYTWRPRVLVDVSAIDLSTTLLGAPVALPVAVAPMAGQGMADLGAEVAMATAAGDAGLPLPPPPTGTHPPAPRERG